MNRSALLTMTPMAMAKMIKSLIGISTHSHILGPILPFAYDMIPKYALIKPQRTQRLF
ncbi:hypothetical protein LR066_01490 [candidate division WOR-3 bacterium]|nr:hypothetical protein [candidate division WOR-3 bacterium]